MKLTINPNCFSIKTINSVESKINSNFFKSNPRLSMMYHLFNRMDVNKQKTHIEVAENFLGNL